jgi:F-type H+-transporting ATPase subunit alpha
MDVEDQVISIFAGTRGFLDDLPVEQVLPFEEGLLKFIKSNKPEIRQELSDKKEISKELEEKLRAAIKEFKDTFVK